MYSKQVPLCHMHFEMMERGELRLVLGSGSNRKIARC